MAAVKDPDSVLHYYRKLIALRKEYPIIVYGKYELLLPDSDELFVYTRSLEGEKLLVVCSFADYETSFAVPEEFAGSECLISNMKRSAFAGEISLEPYEAFVLYKK